MSSRCPSPESVLALVEGRLPSADAGRRFLTHLYRCPDCRSSLSFVAAARLAATGEAPAGITAPVAFRLLQRRVRLCCGEDADGADAFAASAEGGSLFFRSADGVPSSRVWEAEIRLPLPNAPHPAFDVSLRAFAGSGPVSGTFVLFGVSAPVREGKARLSPDALSRAVPSGGVAFVDGDGISTPGVPVLGAFNERSQP